MGGIDLMSMLPEKVVCHILSFLPMHEVVRTSVLSPRWKDLWKFTSCLHFRCYKNYQDYPEDFDYYFTSFLYFTNRVLLLHLLKFIDKLSIELVVDPDTFASGARSLDNWVATAIARNVKNLNIHGCFLQPNHHTWDELNQFTYPFCMFISNSLETLDISNIGTIHPPRVVCLPNVKTLRLVNVDFSCDQSVERLISGCTSLLTLYIRRRRPRDNINVVTFSVQSPTLEDLTISSSSPSDRLVIRTPALKYFCLDCTWAAFLSLENLTFLYTAKITLESYDPRQSSFCGNLIQAIHKVKDLHLNASAIKVVGHLPVCKRFLQLIQLTLEIDHEPKLMWDVLECMPSLETLTLKGNPDTDGPICLGKHRKVPECLATSLKMVSVENFAGRPDQLPMLGHILQNARLLQRVTVRTDFMDIDDKSHFIRELTKFRTSSVMCRMDFS